MNDVNHINTESMDEMLIEICSKVLTRLVAMDDEKGGAKYDEQLIFPCKRDKSGLLSEKKLCHRRNLGDKRISEQELRLLFIEEFKKSCSELFYSIETPTQYKYKFGDSLDKIERNESGQSALLDMCVHSKDDKKAYKRLLNIEFKYGNVPIQMIAKDICKLVEEKQGGAFIWMLKNTNSGTFCNKNEKSGVLDKLRQSFEKYRLVEGKSVDIMIFSLEQNALISRRFTNADMGELFVIFRAGAKGMCIDNIPERDWKRYP